MKAALRSEPVFVMGEGTRTRIDVVEEQLSSVVDDLCHLESEQRPLNRMAALALRCVHQRVSRIAADLDDLERHRVVVQAEAATFEEMVAYGASHNANMVNGVPWSFCFRGCPVTHESNDCYLVQTRQGTVKFNRGDVLLFGTGSGSGGVLIASGPREVYSEQEMVQRLAAPTPLEAQAPAAMPATCLAESLLTAANGGLASARDAIAEVLCFLCSGVPGQVIHGLAPHERLVIRQNLAAALLRFSLESPAPAATDRSAS